MWNAIVCTVVDATLPFCCYKFLRPPLSADLNQSNVLLPDGQSVSQHDELWFDSSTSLSWLRSWPCTTRIHTETGMQGEALSWPRQQTAFMESTFWPECGKDSIIAQLSWTSWWMIMGAKAQAWEHLPQEAEEQHLRSWSSLVARARGQCLAVGAPSRQPICKTSAG